MKKAAFHAGKDFKCLTCCDKGDKRKKYLRDVLLRGIYVSQRAATWDSQNEPDSKSKPLTNAET